MNSQGKPVLTALDSELLRARLAAIIATSDDAIVSKNLDGVVQSWNAAAERIFGYTAAEMVGQPIARMIPPERGDEEPRILERLKRGERVDHFETVRVRKDGSRVEVSVTISPILDSTGRVVGASKIARDISAQKQYEAERERLLASEREAREQAERSSRLKDEFLATLSHEIRTPLNAIYGWAQLLQRKTVPPEEITEGLDVIARNARVQILLIEDLLDMSRIVSGKLRLDVQPIDLGSVIDAAIQSILPAAEAKQISLRRIIDPRAGKVTGDSARLQQVIWNLLSNAVKFTPKLGQVQILLERVNSHLELTVADTGQGINPEFLPYLFERFRQADASTTRRHGGLGLGLSIAKHLVELHGGSIRASSPGPGLGTTIVISLPLRIVRDEPDGPREQPVADGPVAEPEEGRLDGVSVLIVDDEADARDLLRHILEDAGAKVVSSASAEEALGLLGQVVIDIVLSDIGMPLEDGYHLIRSIRKLPDEHSRRIPAVALTAFARGEDRRRALVAGFNMHVAKPVDPAELVAVVGSLTRHH